MFITAALRSFRALALALTCLLLLASAGAGAQVLVLREALSIEADGDSFPETLRSAKVELPDDWSAPAARRGGVVWYRVSFDAPGVPGRGSLLGLYLQRVCSSFLVRLNGQLVHEGGTTREPPVRDCHRPQLVALPAALLRERGNTVDIKVVGQPLARVASSERAGGLSAVEVGPHALLAARQSRGELAAVTLPLLASVPLAMLGALMFLMGWFDRRQSHLAYFGALSIGWACLGARLWWRELPLPNYDIELLLCTFVAMVALATVQFLIRMAGFRSRPIDVALYAQCLMVPASLLLAGPWRMHTMASTWYALLALEVAVAIGFYLRVRWRGDRRRFWPMAALLLAGGVLAALELAGQQRMLDPVLRVWAPLLMPVMLMALGLGLLRRHVLPRVVVEEEPAESLEEKVHEATAELERKFAQLAELRVEQVTERERKRIAADLHDDLGAKLLTIVHTSDDQRISTLAREALEEMRLSVRGLTGKPVRLIDALGDWRAEVVSRLSQAGVQGEWNAPSEDLPQTLSARAYVQTTRILREAVSNIIKHSGASHCSLRCTLIEGDFQLTIQDNGNGIPMELDGRLDRGHGMASMKHRAKQLQGQCLVESGPGYGTVIRLTIPLDRHVESSVPAVTLHLP